MTLNEKIDNTFHSLDNVHHEWTDNLKTIQTLRKCLWYSTILNTTLLGTLVWTWWRK